VILAIIGLLNSGVAAAYYLRLAFVAAQRPEEPDEVRVPMLPMGIAVSASLVLAVIATLVLGIAPGRILKATEMGAHTLQAPPAISVAPETTATQTNQ
jgi:NADH-quinone oxidoreductase subunit N